MKNWPPTDKKDLTNPSFSERKNTVKEVIPKKSIDDVSAENFVSTGDIPIPGQLSYRQEIKPFEEAQEERIKAESNLDLLDNSTSEELRLNVGPTIDQYNSDHTDKILEGVTDMSGKLGSENRERLEKQKEKNTIRDGLDAKGQKILNKKTIIEEPNLARSVSMMEQQQKHDAERKPIKVKSFTPNNDMRPTNPRPKISPDEYIRQVKANRENHDEPIEDLHQSMFGPAQDGSLDVTTASDKAVANKTAEVSERINKHKPEEPGKIVETEKTQSETTESVESASKQEKKPEEEKVKKKKEKTPDSVVAQKEEEKRAPQKAVETLETALKDFASARKDGETMASLVATLPGPEQTAQMDPKQIEKVADSTGRILAMQNHPDAFHGVIEKLRIGYLDADKEAVVARVQKVMHDAEVTLTQRVRNTKEHKTKEAREQYKQEKKHLRKIEDHNHDLKQILHAETSAEKLIAREKVINDSWDNYSRKEKLARERELGMIKIKKFYHAYKGKQANALLSIDANMSGVPRDIARFTVKNGPALGAGGFAAWLLAPIISAGLLAGAGYGLFKFVKASYARGQKISWLN